MINVKSMILFASSPSVALELLLHDLDHLLQEGWSEHGGGMRKLCEVDKAVRFKAVSDQRYMVTTSMRRLMNKRPK